jgi:class 3 adenylate cyclase
MTVNVAARIAAHAEAGQVLISEEAVGHVHEPNVRFERVGPASLKGVAGPVVLYRARWRREQPWYSHRGGASSPRVKAVLRRIYGPVDRRPRQLV